MRTTLTLDPDVAERIDAELRHRGKTLKGVVNDALRRGFGIGMAQPSGPEPYVVKPFSMRLRPGIDDTKLGQLADELEAEETARKLLR